MALNELAVWSTIIQAFVVVISLIFIWLQLWQNTKLAKAANVQALVEHSSSFNNLIIQDYEIARLWYSQGKGLKKLSDVQRYRELVIQWLVIHENVYYQRKSRLLDNRIYLGWREDLKFFVHTQNLDLVTKDFLLFFPGGFGKHIIELKEKSLTKLTHLKSNWSQRSNEKSNNSPLPLH